MMDPMRVQQLRMVFNAIDRNRDHLLNPQELHQAMGELGCPMNYQQVQQFIARFDRTGDRMLNFNEFANLYFALNHR